MPQLPAPHPGEESRDRSSAEHSRQGLWPSRVTPCLSLGPLLCHHFLEGQLHGSVRPHAFTDLLHLVSSNPRPTPAGRRLRTPVLPCDCGAARQDCPKPCSADPSASETQVSALALTCFPSHSPAQAQPCSSGQGMAAKGTECLRSPGARWAWPASHVLLRQGEPPGRLRKRRPDRGDPGRPRATAVQD